MTGSATRLATLPLFVSLVLLVPILWLTWLNRSLITPVDAFVIPLAMVGLAGFATIGTVISSRRPDNAIGWLFQLFTAGFLVSILAGEYARRALVTGPGSLPGGTWALWVSNWFIVPPICLLPLSFLLFPDGSLPSRRWRPVVWALVVGATLAVIASAFSPRIEDEFGRAFANPAGSGPERMLDVFTTMAVVAILAAVISSAGGLIVRFRRSTGVERQQIRWLAYAVSVTVVLFLMTLTYGSLVDPEQETALATFLWTGWTLSLAIGVPGAAAVAILRYRLYDLDLVVKKTVVVALVGAFITLTYVLIAVGLPTLVVGTGGTSGFSPFTLLTTVVVALLFQPVRTRARRLADRLVYGGRATPYEVLSEFSDRLAEAYSSEDVLPRLAQLVGSSTGATEARVWVRVGGELTPVAAWPSAAPTASPLAISGDDLPLPSAFPVRHQGKVLGAITLEMPANDPMDPSKERLVNDVAGQAGLVLRNVRLIEELRASRRRIVAAQDERAKKLERDIHDGAQQQLVALAVKMRLAQGLARRDPAKTEAMLTELGTEANEALENLRDLSRGIYPPLLAEEGLPAALEAQARKSPFPVGVDPDSVGRYPREIESAVYFCILEALNNVAKYAQASRATIRLEAADGELRFEVSDDGVGFDPAATGYGTGLQGVADRLDAIGGRLEIRSAPGGGATVSGIVVIGGAS